MLKTVVKKKKEKKTHLDIQCSAVGQQLILVGKNK